ncbi:MAG: cytochrome c oxidase subunit II [candidate division Zixibacteria bacterium]|nr:cytochrome c oxidase subunit II [candidate division Zixibacteria bacterium]
MLDWLPPNASAIGNDIDGLMTVIYYLTVAVLMGVLSVMGFFLYRYRSRKDRGAAFLESNNQLELVWTGATFLLMVGVVALSLPIWANMRRPPGVDETSVFTVRVTGKQFNWFFTYPGPDTRFGTDDDLRVENEFFAPVDRDVRLLLVSEDVIHGFFVPQFRLKQDAVPGREIKAWFRAIKTGVYEIACAELCGFGHTAMSGRVRILSSQDYAAWQRERWPSASSSSGLP